MLSRVLALVCVCVCVAAQGQDVLIRWYSNANCTGGSTLTTTRAGLCNIQSPTTSFFVSCGSSVNSTASMNHVSFCDDGACATCGAPLSFPSAVCLLNPPTGFGALSLEISCVRTASGVTGTALGLTTLAGIAGALLWH